MLLRCSPRIGTQRASRSASRATWPAFPGFMTSQDLVGELHAGRQRFLALVGELRPELHRYCARMTGSIADGEDVVQDTLARAYYALSALEEVPPLRPWLFQIAHNRAIDFRRRYDQRMRH